MRKKKKKNQPSSEYIGQLTIGRFADAKAIGSRMSKSNQTNHMKLIEDADHDGDIDIDSDAENVSLKDRLNQTEVNRLEQQTEKEGINYPYDLWEILSEYISPESVSKFACLCRSAYISTNRVSFWLTLYQVYADQVSRKVFKKSGKEILPNKLQSDYVNRFCQGNLRSNVIRSLFFTHEPFKQRLLSLHNKIDPHAIVGLLCIGTAVYLSGIT